MDTNITAIALKVDAARRAKGVGKLPLATAAGIPISTLTRMLSGNNDFKFSNLLRVAEALDVDPATWLRDDTGAAA
ncbi:XRE family transcriptional regulator [Cryobacterium sp. Sr8]|uniref:helix-turn-helix domain-containing protein n=1 Tax=Cryobacterium sp. Sr8 TaxID=1259203 RepID=UPI00106BA6B2|nr:helix-turn-helix transcriptional regulator [Cryobacterium sp. Sr8]TFD80680.1 XRE family transcriptional regulator [Cryobacterium sp. Sr8]